MATLGVRNNNPFNLRSNHVEWLGKVGSNNGFCVFKDMDTGVRAGLINLATQIRRSVSLSDLINRYAPSSENDSDTYYRYISTILGDNWYSFVYDKDKFLALAYYIVKFEGCTTPLSVLTRIENNYHIFEKHLVLLQNHG